MDVKSILWSIFILFLYSLHRTKNLNIFPHKNMGNIKQKNNII